MNEIANGFAHLSNGTVITMAFVVVTFGFAAFAVCWPDGRKKSARIAAPVWNRDLK